tara:strand:+ start:9887 stop:10147 length:261 start_codon:yes stop_codon:yes gene_type:complete
MLLPLTEKQKVVFEALTQLYTENSYPPTQAEISDYVKKSAVSGEIRALRQKGWLEKLEHLSRRNIVPTEEAFKRFTQKDILMEKRI